MSSFDDLEFTEVEVSPEVAAHIRGESGSDPASIGSAMQAAFDKLMSFLQLHSLVPAGPPRAIYTSYGPEGAKFIVAMPIAAPSRLPMEGDMGYVDNIAGGKALRFTHRGPYPELMRTYGRITQFMQEKGLLESEADWVRYMPMWEEYVNDPRTTPAADLVTYIYLPVA